VLNSVGLPEVFVLIGVALFIFGPERLPQVAAEAGRMLRTLRQLASNAKEDLRSELGPELGDLDFAALNPKTFIRKNLFEDDEPDATTSSPPRPTAAAAQQPLSEGEPAPYDPDTT
jgi:sec-independent protein translocase protein TatB